MMSPCDAVIERVALGESLDPFADHIASCKGCTRLVEMPRRLGAARSDIDPGLGFSARMTVGAQQRIAVRRRRRVAAGLAATVAAGSVGVYLFTRTPEPAQPKEEVAVKNPTPEEDPTPPAPLEEADLKALVKFADTKRSSRLSANWGTIEKPLSAYKKLVKGVTP